jgi:ankyrin repeat protein
MMNLFSSSQSKNMSLLKLPVEIICMIAERIPTQAGVKAFMMSHRRIYSLHHVRTALYNTTGETRLNYTLLWACQKNNQDLARAMLRLGADIKCSNGTMTYTPLTFAATEGHEEIVKLLLEHDPSIVNEAAERGDRALRRAIWKGHIEIVKILLTQPDLDPFPVQRGPDLDFFVPGPDDEMPINEALTLGNEEIVQILMEDRRFKLDYRSLAAASKGGNERLVKICLQGAPLKDEYWSERPLCIAANLGHEGAMTLLLEDGRLDPNKPNNYSQTPLDCAASRGHANIVRILLDRDDVELDLKGLSQRTPFSNAARHGNIGVMKLLLESGKVDPDSRDCNRRTPLSRAAENEEPAAVSFLLATGKVDPDSKCNRRRTPLSWAASNGVSDTVRVLLETGRVNPNSTDEDGRTPISLAAGSSNYFKLNRPGCPNPSEKLSNICRLLQGRPDLVSGPNIESRQRVVARAGWPDPLYIIEQLLAFDEVNPDLADNMGQTPLMFAAQNRQVDVVRLLMATGKVNPDRRDNDGWTAKTHAEKRSKPKSGGYDADGWDAWESSFDGP